MKDSIIVLFLVAVPLLSFSQIDSHYVGSGQGGLGSDGVAFSPKTPKESLFENYVEYPEINNTGRINISLPLYQVNVFDIDFGINLVYNTEGIKVDDKASNVGTGWHLMTGGAITRTVKDIPDDAHYYQTAVNSCPAFGLETIGWLYAPDAYMNSNIRDFPDVMGAYSTANPNYSQHYKDKQYAGTAINSLKGPDNSMVRDFEPDIFHFNVNGKSFEFVFTEDGTPKILGNEKFKIDYNIVNQPDIQTDPQTDNTFCPNSEFTSLDYNKYIGSFTITDAEGYQYRFFGQDVERTTATHKKYSLEGVVEDPDDPFVVGENFFVLEEAYPPYISTWRLSRIVSPTGREIDFHYETQIVNEKPEIPVFKGHCETGNCVTDTNRNKFQLLDFDTTIDRRSSYEISEKVLYRISMPGIINVDFVNSGNRLDSDGGKELAEIQIKKGNLDLLYKYKFYYHYMDSGTCPTNIKDSRWCKRLFLDRIEKESVVTSDKIQFYQFEYNPGALPPRYSYEQDFWGHYNGNGAQSLIPKLYVYPTNPGKSKYHIYPIPSLSQTEFILSGADRTVSPSNILVGMLNKVTFPTGGHRKYVFEPNQFYDEYAGEDNYGGGLRIKQIKHNDGEGNEIVKNYSYTEIANGQERSSGHIYAFPIFAEATNYFFRPQNNVLRSYLTTYNNTSYYTPDGFNWAFGNLHNQYVLTEFDRWDKYTKRSSHPFNKLTDKKGNTVLYTKIIESITGNGRKEYEFLPPEVYRGAHATQIEQGVSMNSLYGNINVYPPPSYVQSIFRDDGNFSESYLPFGSFKGNIDTGMQDLIPYPPNSHPTDSYSFSQGMVWKITNLSEDDKKITETLFNYYGFRDDSEIVYGLVYKVYEALYGSSLNQSEIAWAKYHHVLNSGAKIRSVTTKTYDQDNPNNYVEKIENYEYDLLSSGYRHLRKVITSSSTGNVHETEYFYPHDLSGSVIGGISLQPSYVSAIESLQNLHRYVDRPVLTVTKVKDPISSETLTTQKKLIHFYETSGLDDFTMVLPKVVQESKGPSSFFDLINYKRYNSYGQPIEVVRGPGGPSVNYLWGYYKQYLVAEIKGIDYTSIPSTLRASIENSSNESQLLPLFDDLRNTLPTDVLMTGYTYQPLIGVTSITDPIGHTTYYEYDSFYRLKTVKDSDGNLIQEHKYNYKNQ